MLASSFKASFGGGKAMPVDDLFETCDPEDDLFFGSGPAFPEPLKTMDAGAGKMLEAQRASLASTECPSSFSHTGFDLSSFDSFDVGSPLADAGLGFGPGDLFGDLPTSALARRAKTLAKAYEAPLPQPQPTSRMAPEVPPPPQPNDDEDLPSIGAALHAAGECTPCKFFRGRRGCKDGKACTLCHHKHDELTYSGIRRLMRKKALEGREPGEPEAPAAAAPLAWRPPPGLPEPAQWGMSAAYMGACC